MTLVELLLAVALVGVLAAIAVPASWNYVERARRADAIADIQSLQTKLVQYYTEAGRYPDSLSDVPWTERDPWGSPYRYLKIEGAPHSVIGQARKDRFLVPLNSTYDFYSVGPDGDSKPPLNAKKSHDDILRANDGQYIGLAAAY
jgi:general secretion pathway protein G